MTTTTLPTGTVGVPYSNSLPVPQPASPLKWSVSAGTLPGGIVLSPTTGQLTGTPTVAGTYGFTVKVTDANTQYSSTALAMSVGAAPYPNASNTGPVAGTVLKTIGTSSGQVSNGPGWTYANGYVRISGANTVFSGFSATCPIAIFANGVTVENCVISCGGQNTFPVCIENDANNNGNPITSVTVQNCTISGSDNNMNRASSCIKDIYGSASGVLIKACNMYWAGTGVQVFSGDVLNNYIHDLVCNVTYGDHVNGVIVCGGTAPMLIQGNTIQNPNGQTDCVAIFQDISPPAVANKTINNNLLAGGGYCIYGGDGGASYTGSPATNIVITNNAISTMYFPNGGAWGPVAYFNVANSGNKWTGNVWHDGPHTGATIPAP